MTEKRLLGIAPLFDDVTEYSFDWFQWTMQQIEEDITVIRHEDGEAVKGTVLFTLRNLSDIEWCVHYDHGSEYVLWGDDEQPIINLDNLSELAGLHVYNMNCLSGKGLGVHAVGAGILEFLGYNEAYAFTTDSLEENKQATAFGLIKAIKEGKDLKDVVELMRQNGYDIADQLKADGKWLAAAALIRNMNSLVCYCEGCPPPPDPECVVSRMIMKALGWRALGFLRRARQKLRPEEFKKVYQPG